jgi:hypothetical protein
MQEVAASLKYEAITDSVVLILRARALLRLPAAAVILKVASKGPGSPAVCRER